MKDTKNCKEEKTMSSVRSRSTHFTINLTKRDYEIGIIVTAAAYPCSFMQGAFGVGEEQDLCKLM